jgi:hypothetical protein
MPVTKRMRMMSNDGLRVRPIELLHHMNDMIVPQCSFLLSFRPLPMLAAIA